jgi:hypothetical protein
VRKRKRKRRRLWCGRRGDEYVAESGRIQKRKEEKTEECSLIKRKKKEDEMELERYVKAELSQLISETIPHRREETDELEREIREYFVVVHEEPKNEEEVVKMKELEGNEPTKGVMKKREEKKVEDEER